jgi:hypothetical protein
MTILLFNHLNECWKKHKNPFKSARASMSKHSPKLNIPSFSSTRRDLARKVLKGGLNANGNRNK